jgi:hypothetical protein
MDTFEHVVGVILSQVLPLLIGSGVGVLAILSIYESVRRLYRGVVTTGTVVGYQLVEDCYCPIVEFTAPDGSPRRFTSDSGRGTKQYREGKRVTVVYDPTKQSSAAIRSFSSLWLFPVVLTAFATVFLCAGLGVFRSLK